MLCRYQNEKIIPYFSFLFAETGRKNTQKLSICFLGRPCPGDHEFWDSKMTIE